VERLQTTRCEYETATYTCPKCRTRIQVLADEYGDHPCGRCGWEPYNDEEESEDDDWFDDTYDCGCCTCCGCMCGLDDEEEDE